MFLGAAGLSAEAQISEINAININKSNHTNTLLSNELLFTILGTSNALCSVCSQLMTTLILWL
jgi:hypothetical protein